jgi:hypothetical protein
MADYGSVPLTGLYILPQGALLQVEATCGVKDMQVYYRMEQLAAIVTLATRSATDYTSLLINKGKEFLVVILHHYYLQFYDLQLIYHLAILQFSAVRDNVKLFLIAL